MEAVRVLNVGHLDSDALQVLKPRVGARCIVLRLEVQLAAPDPDRLLPRTIFRLLHLIEESRPLVHVAALEMGLSQALFAQLDREVGPVGHLDVAEEGAALVGEDEFDGDVTLIEVRFRQPQRVVSVLEQCRLVLVLGHGAHTEQVNGNHAAFLLQPHLELHAAEAVLHDTAERLFFPFEHHRFVLFRLLGVLGQVSKNGHRWLLGRVMQT